MRVVEGISQRTYTRTFYYYGYDIYLSNLAANALGLQHQTEDHQAVVAVLLDAAWWFVGKGILRPGVRSAGEQSTEEGATVGFSITQLGRGWLAQPSPEFIPMT